MIYFEYKVGTGPTSTQETRQMFATKEQAVEMAIAEIEATGAEAAIRQFGPCTSVHVAGQNPDDGRIAIAPVWGGTLDDPQIDGWQHRHVEGIIELER